MSALALLIALSQPLDAPPPDPQREMMALETWQDPITDRVSAFGVLRTDGARLSIGCDPQRWRGLRVVLNPTAYLPDEPLITGAHKFAYRFDKTLPRRVGWTSDGDQAVLRRGRQTGFFIGQALTRSQVAVQIEDAEGRTLSFIFSLEGARQVLPHVLRLCGAPLGVPRR